MTKQRYYEALWQHKDALIVVHADYQAIFSIFLIICIGVLLLIKKNKKVCYFDSVVTTLCSHSVSRPQH